MATALRERGFVVVGAADTLAHPVAGVEVVLIFAGAPPSRVIVVVRKYRLLYPEAVIVLVGADHPDHELLLFIEAGIQAYTSSSASLDELVQTIIAARR